MRVLGVIPARLGSTRIPHKPLQLLAGEPLVTRVIRRVQALGVVEHLVVATDSTMVARVVELTGVPAVLTRDTHASGTERVAEVAGRREYAGFDVIANVQGDAPFLPGPALAGAVSCVTEQGFDIGTAAAPLEARHADAPDRVKVVTDERGRALYFSRALIPWRDTPAAPRDLYWQHLGVYVYRREALERWISLAPTPAEQAERLEQLRALHYGLSIGVARLTEPALPAVDSPEDLRRAEAEWLIQGGQT